MKYKPINIFEEIFGIILTTLMMISIPASVFNLVFASNVVATIFHSVLLMYITSCLTIKAFAWKVHNDK